MILIFLIIAPSMYAQNNRNNTEAQRKAAAQRQLRQAQKYQSRNQHENALRILVPLYNRNPGNMQFYSALLDSYFQLSMLPSAEQLIQKQREKNPGNPRYDIDYGEMRFRANDKESARQIWDEVLKKHIDNVGVFTMVANVMARNRLDDDAAEVYMMAFKHHPEKVYLLKSLGDFYRQRLKYEDALKYYFDYVRREPENYRNVIRQILSFKLDEETQVEPILKIISEETKKSKGLAEARIITAKFYQKYRRYEDALMIYKALENKETQGKYLLEYGSAVLSDSVYNLALSAYNTVIERFPDANNVLPAYLGAARCNMALASKNNDQEYARQAAEIIKKVQQEYPRHNQVAQLSLLEGDIYRQFFFDIDKAIDTYLQVARKYNTQSNIREKAYRKAGESYIIRGDLEKADEILNRVTSPKEKPQAAYLQAKIAYYQGNYEDTRAHLSTILKVEGIAGKVANDVLALQGILLHESSAPEALKFYAQADWLLMQEKKSEAISKLQNALDLQPPGHFKIRILFDAAGLASEIGEYPTALEYCNQVLTDESLKFYADEAIYIMAGIFDFKLNDYAKAYELYDRILAEFSDSQFVLPARDRLKDIRRKNPDFTP